MDNGFQAGALHEVQQMAEFVQIAQRRAKNLELTDEYAAQIGRRLVPGCCAARDDAPAANQGFERARPYRLRSEEHTSQLQSLMRTSYAVFCLKKQIKRKLSQNLSLDNATRTTT